LDATAMGSGFHISSHPDTCDISSIMCYLSGERKTKLRQRNLDPNKHSNHDHYHSV